MMPRKPPSPCPSDRHPLVLRNLRLARWMAWKWRGRSPALGRAWSKEELESFALEALVVAARGYDPSFGVKFGTYAYGCIRMRFKRLSCDARGREEKEEEEGRAREVPADRQARRHLLMIPDPRQPDPSAAMLEAEAGEAKRRDEKEAMRLLRRLEKEKPREAMAVRIHAMQGVAWKEAGRMIGMREDSAQKAAYRGLERMRAWGA